MAFGPDLEAIDDLTLDGWADSDRAGTSRPTSCRLGDWSTDGPVAQGRCRLTHAAVGCGRRLLMAELDKAGVLARFLLTWHQTHGVGIVEERASDHDQQAYRTALAEYLEQ